MKNFTINSSASNHHSEQKLNEEYTVKTKKKRNGYSSVLYYEKELSTGKLSPEVPEVFTRASDVWKPTELDSPDCAYTQKGTSRNKLKLQYKLKDIGRPNSLEELDGFKYRRVGHNHDRKSRLSNKPITTINLNVFSSESPSGKDDNSGQKPSKPQPQSFSVLINHQESVEAGSPTASTKFNSQPTTTMISKYIHHSSFPHSKSNVVLSGRYVSASSNPILGASKAVKSASVQPSFLQILQSPA